MTDRVEIAAIILAGVSKPNSNLEHIVRALRVADTLILLDLKMEARTEIPEDWKTYLETLPSWKPVN